MKKMFYFKVSRNAPEGKLENTKLMVPVNLDVARRG